MSIVVLTLYNLEARLAGEFGLFLSGDIFTMELMRLIFIATLIVPLLLGITAYKQALHTQLSSN